MCHAGPATKFMQMQLTENSVLLPIIIIDYFNYLENLYMQKHAVRMEQKN